MKKSFLQRNRSNHANLRRVLIALVIFLALIYILSLVRTPLVSLVTPLWQGENMASRTFAGVFSHLRDKSELIKENMELKAKIYSYEAERAVYAGWRARETELLGLLGRVVADNFIVASVLARPPQSPYDVLILDAGSDDGVALNDEVRMAEGAILGIITEVLPRTSKTKLFTASGEETSVILERGGVSALLVGAGGGMFTLSLQRKIEVEVGDRILSADIGSRLVAIISHVSMKPTDSFKEVLARSPINMFGVRSVLIAK